MASPKEDTRETAYDPLTSADVAWLKGLQVRLRDEARRYAKDGSSQALIVSAVRISESEAVRRALAAIGQPTHQGDRT